MGVFAPYSFPSHVTKNPSKIRRLDEQTVASSSSTLIYSPSNGAWSDAILGSQSCALSAQSSISSGSYIEFRFVGTSLTVDVIKDIDGAPYNVTIDGEVHAYDSYAESQQCASDYEVADLAAREHVAIVTHNGNSSLLASGISQLKFISFRYSPSANTDPLPTSRRTPVGAIIGGVIGGIAVLIFICGFIFWQFRRARVRSSRVALHSTKEEAVSQPYEMPNPIHFAVSSLEMAPNQSNTVLLPTRKAKGDNNHLRYPRSSPWHSSSSNNNNSRQNGEALDPGNQPTHSDVSDQSAGESPPPTSILNSHPAFSVTEMSFGPSSSLPDLPVPRRRHYAAPSAAGESVLIDDPNYIPPPSYSPPPTNHPRIKQSIQQTISGKAVYDGPDDSGIHEQPLPPSQTLSPADIDTIARRVVDLMRSPDDLTGTSNTRESGRSLEAQNPQVQQAIRTLLSRQDNSNPSRE